MQKIMMMVSAAFMLAASPANAGGHKCVVIPYQSATEDEGGWSIDADGKRKSRWIGNSNVRRASR